MMTESSNLLGSIWIPILNSVLFLVFGYMAFTTFGPDNMLPFLAISFVISFVLALRSKIYSLGRAYAFYASLPVLIVVILGVLIGTGLIWIILGMFGIFGYVPN